MSCIKPERECPVLSDIQHGVMTMTGKFFGDRAHYTCDPDYYTVGLTERTCRGDGKWTGTTPSCKKDASSFCSQPPKVKNARHNAPAEQTTFDLGSDVQYSCDHRYTTSGIRKAKCLMMDSVASWFGPDITCEPKVCGPPADIANGWHAGECYTYDCRVSYHCADGYELVGKAEKLCLEDGTWTPKESPQCVQVTTVQCPKPENPVNGNAVYTSYAYNSIVSYECKYGYTVVGATTRRCGADRKWTGKTPTCQEINCGSPGVLYNGWIENIEAGTGLGASIIFRCNDHMKLEGNTSSVCQIDGKWRYPVPQCLAPCVVPQIENGNITVASHDRDHINNVTVVEHGERLLVSCEENYEFAANSTPVVCNNGTWSIVPSCSPARCKQLPRSPKNGMVIAPKTDHGMKAVFKCKDGFEIVGGGPLNASLSVECQYGNWIGDIPHCNQVFCPFPGFIENGKVFLMGNMGVYDYRPYVRKVVNNKQIMYDCDKGYVLDDGPTGATCIGGSWHPKELPKCIPGQHPRLRWSRRRRSVNEEDLTMNYRKFIEFFRKIGKKLLHLEMNKGKEHSKHKLESKNSNSSRNDNTTEAPSWKKHSGHGNRSRLREEKMIDFLKIVYRKLQRIDARQSNNSTNGSMHDLLNAMSKNFFHVDLSESRRNNSGRGRSDFEIRNQREFIKLKREFERIMRFYNKSMRWNEKQNRKDSKRKGQSHGDKGKKSKDKKKHRKNYYKGFYEFVNSYVTEKLSMLENRNATEELMKNMKIDKFTVRNGTTFTVGEMYAFFKHIIEAKLNDTTEDVTEASTTVSSTSTSATSTAIPSIGNSSSGGTVAPPSTAWTSSSTTTTPVTVGKEIESRNNRSSVIPRNESSVLDNEIPAKEGMPKHRSKRIRNASEDSGPPRQKRRLLSLNDVLMVANKENTNLVESSPRRSGRKRISKRSSAYDDEKTRLFTFKELEAQQQSRSKRFLPPSELDNQIFLKNLYLHAYEDEYRANVKRSIVHANRTNEKQEPAVYRRRKGNLDAYEIK
ncbi:Sushi, von Willebrand factor type A, EGF and pentraxin domain-containing protein [Apis cerana cerana]|uniref:Sushi, von Willebrand factor type A, EGF and pentraxin domain-containing protein n=1 Tax=Apis cerana cerana TaxID=94128 RepID=A0A2A3EIN7_APICC|nr:Sushi, von Willebrand factor type A, EGF and pentraxin domain-containing protein [Apis cerana cerana]